jgi:hypothetical protein
MNKETNSMMDPKYLLLDFEQALSDAFVDIFPNTIIARDRFHFVQANVKRLIELGLQSLIDEVSKDLEVLWEQPTKAEFDACVTTFLNKWDVRSRAYSEGYFRPTWLNRYPPHEWAGYGRSEDTPEGNPHIFFCMSYLTNI